DACVTLCSLGAIALWIRDDERATRHGVWAYPLLLVVALGFKESAAILPLQMAVLAWGWPTPRRRTLLAAVIAGFAIFIAYFAWRALAIGVALARRTEAAAAMWRAAIALVACAVVAGAALLHVMLREVAAAQADSRALVDALARWASTHEDPVMVVVPENRGAVVLFRNGQGGIVLPPVQEKAILDRVVPAMPVDIPKRYGEFANGLATRLVKLAPTQANAEVLKQL